MFCVQMLACRFFILLHENILQIGITKFSNAKCFYEKFHQSVLIANSPICLKNRNIIIANVNYLMQY